MEIDDDDNNGEEEYKDDDNVLHSNPITFDAKTQSYITSNSMDNDRPPKTLHIPKNTTTNSQPQKPYPKHQFSIPSTVCTLD